MSEINANPPAHARGVLFGYAVNALCAVIAVGLAVTAFVVVYRLAVDVPVWDEWEWGRMIIALHSGALTFSALWWQHNEHRMFFPNLVMLFLDSFGYWSQRRECLASVVVVTGSLWLYWQIAQRTLSLRAALIVTAIGSLFLFSPSQSENWLQGFQTAWFMVDMAVLGAALCLAGTEWKPRQIAIATACAVIAAYSSTFGLALLPSVAAALYLRRHTLGYVPLLQWAGISIVIIVLYFVGWTPSDNTGVHSASAIMLRIEGMLAVAGLPFGLGHSNAISAGFGFVGLALAAVLLAMLVREDDHIRLVRAAPWVVTLGYGAVSSVLIGYGRAADPSASRYVTCSLMLWIGLAGLIAVRLPRQRPALNGIAVRAVAVAALIFIAGFVGTWRFGVQALASRSEYYRVENGILADYRHAKVTDLATLYPDTNIVRDVGIPLQKLGQLPEMR